ncbi:MAG: ABC transporter permease, partial [Aquabacterium sp.]
MDLPFKFVTLWTDVVLWVMLLGLGLYVRQVRRDAALRATWRRVFVTPSAMASSVLLCLMLLMTLADSMHFRRALPDVAGGVRAFDTRTESVLDIGLAKLIASRENSYSQPLATHGFSKESVPPQPDAKPVLDEHGVPTLPARAYPRLRHGGAGLADAERDWAGDIAVRLA